MGGLHENAGGLTIYNGRLARETSDFIRPLAAF
jgi:hypothetical protein